MADKQILNYIKQTAEQGFTPEQIRQALRQAGWLENEIQNAFEHLHQLENANQGGQSPKPGRKGARTAALLAIIIILLAGLAYFAYLYYQKNFAGALNRAPNSVAEIRGQNISSETARDGESKNRDRARLEHIYAAQTALEKYFDANLAYPGNLADLAIAGFLEKAPRDPLTEKPYLYTPFGQPPTHYSLTFILENAYGELPAGLMIVSSENLLSADLLKKQEAVIAGEGGAENNGDSDFQITDLSRSPFFPEEEATVTIESGRQIANAFLITDHLRLADRTSPFQFRFTAPALPGEYEVKVFAFDEQGGSFEQTTVLKVQDFSETSLDPVGSP